MRLLVKTICIIINIDICIIFAVDFSKHISTAVLSSLNMTHVLTPKAESIGLRYNDFF